MVIRVYILWYPGAVYCATMCTVWFIHLVRDWRFSWITTIHALEVVVLICYNKYVLQTKERTLCITVNIFV
jgi:hypothetical protein